MALEMYDAVNLDGLFNVLGRMFYIVNRLNLCRLDTVPDAVENAVNQYKLDTDAPASVGDEISAVVTQLDAWKTSGSPLASRVASMAQKYVLECVEANIGLPNKSLTNAIAALIDAMDGNYYVTPNVVSVTVTPTVSATDWSVVSTLTHGDGKALTLPLAETITITPTNDSPPVLRVTSPDAVQALSQDWPGGSGLSGTLESSSSASNLLTNGGFETVADSFPSGWVPRTGVVGTDWTVTSVEVQTVVIAGTPTSGFYFLRVTCPDGIERVTERLAYNATAATLQSALRKLSGLEQVTVTATGTTPNYTHTVTFAGVAGNVTIMASISHLNTGTISHAETTTGSTNAFTGRGLVLTGDGSTTAEVVIELPALTSDTVYCLHWRHKISTGATGVVRWAVLDSVAGSVVNDSEGTANSVAVDISTLTTSFAVGTLWIRVPPSLKQPAFLSIKATTAVANTKLYCLDEVVLVKAKQLYAGGPYAAAFRGNVPPLPTEYWDLVVANNRAGTLHEWFDRCFNLRGSNLLLPTSGGTSIPNSVVS